MQNQKRRQVTKVIADATTFVTPEEVAPVLRRTATGVRYMLREGLLPGKKIGGKWYLFRRDVEALITPPDVAVYRPAFPRKPHGENAADAHPA